MSNRCVACQVAATAEAKHTSANVIRVLCNSIGLEPSRVMALLEGAAPAPVQQLKPSSSVEVPADVVAVVEGLLWDPDIHRKPPRVAAPRLVERLVAAGIIEPGRDAA